MDRTLLRLLMLPLIALSLAVAAGAQANDDCSPIVDAKNGTVTIYPSRLGGAITLDALWRLNPNDDPRFADASFDDSEWPLIQPGEDRLLADAHLSNIPGGHTWTRLHLHVLGKSGLLAIAVDTRASTPYALFANGKRIGGSRGLGTAFEFLPEPALIVLPPGTDVVLAIHTANPSGALLHYVPLEHIVIGSAEAVGTKVGLEHYHDFEEYLLVSVAMAGVYFACVPVCIVLLLIQPRHREYLWLAIYCFFLGAVLAWTLGWEPVNRWSVGLIPFLSSGTTIVSLEFISDFAEMSNRRVVRIVQGLFFFNIVFDLFFNPGLGANAFGVSSNAYWVIELALTLLYLFAVAYVLWPAFRKGKMECGLLLVPMYIQGSVTIVNLIRILLPNQFATTFWIGHIGGVGFTGMHIGTFLFLASMLAVLIYRFNRISKDEEIAAAELEAAKTVQQLLIPATQPETPGFVVESAYLPARQVGGDFFLVLPAEAGSGDASLLAVMGDVSGKGLQAAMVVSTIIGGLRMGLVRRPADVLMYLNRMLIGHISGFATCCSVLITPDGQVTIANAGNPAPYAGGEEILTLPGLPLGMVAGVSYEETEYRLRQGEGLTFVSDGVVEATSAAKKELFGFERTRAISHESAAAIAEAACQFGAGAPQADDITVLTVKLA